MANPAYVTRLAKNGRRMSPVLLRAALIPLDDEDILDLLLCDDLPLWPEHNLVQIHAEVHRRAEAFAERPA